MNTGTAARVGIEIGAVFAAGFKGVFSKANDEINGVGSTIKKLEARQKELNGVIKEQERLGRNGSPLKALYAQQEIEQVTEKITKLREEQQKLITKGANFRALGDSMRSIGSAAQEVGGHLKSLVAQTAVLGAGIGYFFKKNFIDTAAQFEKFQTILETTEGSSEKARKSMQWVSDFAAKTPFELAEVTEAFVKLRAYGLDPTNGLLQTLGDTGAAMGKPVMQAVEAIADAVTGENERLKEFGIKARKAGGKITYEYTDKDGKQQAKTVDANNRKIIESTLTAIWNEKYGGAMNKLSKTWGGMTSNVGDQWTRFTNMVMQSGPFEMLKGRLSGVLATIDQMASDGRLKAYAEQTGAAITEFAKGAWELGSTIVSVTRSVADFVGGWKNLLVAVSVIKFAPLVISIVKLGIAFGVATTSALMFVSGATTAGAAWAFLGKSLLSGAGMVLTALRAISIFMLTNPIGITLLALAAAATLIYRNWEPISAFFVELWGTIKQAASVTWDWIKSAWLDFTPLGIVIQNWEPIRDFFASLFGDIKGSATAAIDWVISKIEAVGALWQKTKEFFGFGGDVKISGGAQSGASPTVSSAVPVVPPASRSTSVTQQTTITAPITINGASDPQATSRIVREELDRRERAAQAKYRSRLVDDVGM